MLEAKAIMSDEGKYLEGTLSKLIGRHNVLCDIEHIFDNDVLAYEYFENARQEVLESGNQSYGAMLALTIKNMLEDIREHKKEEEPDIEKMRDYTHELESKYRVVQSQLNTINNILKEFGYE